MRGLISTAPSGAPRTVRAASILSSALLVPFVVLEVVNRWTYQEGLPIILFGVMWILGFLFVLLLAPLLRRPAMSPRRANAFPLAVRVALLAFLGWIWVAAVVDQMPCFLGVPLCD
jgi:hypothetical protein